MKDKLTLDDVMWNLLNFGKALNQCDNKNDEKALQAKMLMFILKHIRLAKKASQKVSICSQDELSTFYAEYKPSFNALGEK